MGIPRRKPGNARIEEWAIRGHLSD